jgi:hypothetical protein
MNLTKSRTAKFIAGIAGFAMALSFVVTPVTTSAATVAELQAMIASLSAQLAALSGTPVASTGYTFNTNLTLNSKGTDVMNLQKVLNMSADTQVASTGAGSPGNETSFFGPATKAAVVKFQVKYGITPAAGYVGAITRAKLNSMGGTVVPPVVTPGLPTGGSLVVMAGSQPSNSLAPESAARLPFTTFSIQAGSSDVTVNSVTVERVGLGIDANFAGIVLLKSDGTQIGIAKTLNSNHQAMVGEAYVVKAGTTETFTVAGNMTGTLDNYAGQVVGLNVVAVNTSATVTGSLPIMGAQHTINATLTLGEVTPSRGATDPNSSVSKEVGTTNYTFSSVKVEAGSQEQVRLWSIRFNQSGSASKSDLSNVMVYVDGTGYPTTVSSDGKYYSASFPGGLLIDKGLSKEVAIKGDIVGGSNRTVAFDLYKNTDLYVSGVTYGYGITPKSTGAGFAVTTPWYDASVVSITGGSASTISQSNTVAAQNIAVLVSDQPLGGFEAKIRGEAITVGQMVFNITAAGDEAENITNVKLVDKNGAVLAGPVDAVSTATNSAYGTVTFTDSVRLPVGDTTLRLVGRLGSTFVSGDTVQASTTPSSQWTTVTGESTGDTVSLSSFSSAIQGNLMTVKSGALAMSVSSQPSARQVIAGAQNFEFARYVLDAGQSGEDVRLANFKALLALSTVTASQLSNCGLYDGSTNLTDGTNVTLAAGDNTFTFNNGGFVVPKGTSKTLSMKCSLSAGATSGTVTWGLTDNSGTYTAATGVTSGLTIVESMTAAAGQAMTAATTGTYTVTNDSSVLYKVAQAGTSGVELAKLRFTAGASEALDLKQIALVLGNAASSSPADLVGERVTLWNGSTQIGYAQFGGANPDHATSTLLSPAPRIAAGESLVITVKGDLSAQNINEGTPGAFIAVNYNGDNNGVNGNYGTGADSQSTVSGGTAGTVSTNGMRIFRTVPTVAVTSNGGTLSAGGDLYKFTVTNSNNRDVVFYKFSFSVATSGGATNGFILYGDGVAFNNSTSTVNNETVLNIVGTGTSQAQIVPANSTKTYILKASTAVDTASVSESISLALLADTSFPSMANLMGTATALFPGTTNKIVWSPFSTTTAEATAATLSNLDWTNGYGMPGFPSNSSFPVQTWTRAN